MVAALEWPFLKDFFALHLYLVKNQRLVSRGLLESEAALPRCVRRPQAPDRPKVRDAHLDSLILVLEVFDPLMYPTR